MSKKDFTDIKTSRVFGQIEEATAEPTRQGEQQDPSEEEAAQRLAELRTQGRKGMKAARISMAFTPDNHDYIRIMAGVTGNTMTEFVNKVIDQHREENSELYDQAKRIRKSL